jgi:two-component sensor histidine kinase
VRGGFGFFLSEVLINAIRHGRPGSMPRVRIALDRVRRELVFEVENEVRSEARSARDGAFEPAASVCGGTGILRQLARLFVWDGPGFARAGGRFRVTWKVPVSERGDPRRAD